MGNSGLLRLLAYLLPWLVVSVCLGHLAAVRLAI